MTEKVFKIEGKNLREQVKQITPYALQACRDCNEDSLFAFIDRIAAGQTGEEIKAAVNSLDRTGACLLRMLALAGLNAVCELQEAGDEREAQRLIFIHMVEKLKIQQGREADWNEIKWLALFFDLGRWSVRRAAQSTEQTHAELDYLVSTLKKERQ